MSPMNMELANATPERKQMCKWMENAMKNCTGMKDIRDKEVNLSKA